MKHDFDNPVERKHSASLKWDRYAGRDIIPMWVADMDFSSPSAVLEALKKRVDHGIFGYGVAPKGVSEAVIHYLESQYTWQIRPEWIVWLPGLVTGLNVMCRAVGEAGCGVLTTTPVYPPFLAAPGNMDRRLVTSPLVKDRGRWVMDFDHLKAAINPGTRLFLFCNPHNPTGRAYSKDELLQLAALCGEKDLVICSDEIHCDLVLDTDKTHIPLACLDPEIGQRTITLMAPSKTYNIPGLGCSYAIIPNAKLRRDFQSATDGIVPHVNVLGYVAAEAAYKEGGKWLCQAMEYLRGNRDIVEKCIAGIPGLSITHVEATYLAWIDAREAVGENPHGFFEKAGVGMSDGRRFRGDGFLRLNFGCSRSLLEKALGRMEKAAAQM